MSTIAYTMAHLPEPGNAKAFVVTWANMQNGDVGQALPLTWSYADKSVQVEGTFGTGGMLAFQGSNDGVNYHTLTNPASGTPLSITSASLQAITEMASYYQPLVASGDGATLLTVSLLLRRTTPGL